MIKCKPHLNQSLKQYNLSITQIKQNPMALTPFQIYLILYTLRLLYYRHTLTFLHTQSHSLLHTQTYKLTQTYIITIILFRDTHRVPYFACSHSHTHTLTVKFSHTNIWQGGFLHVPVEQINYHISQGLPKTYEKVINHWIFLKEEE